MSEMLYFTWKLYINGVIVEGLRKQCIESLDYFEQAKGSNTLTILVKDPEMLFIEDNIFITDAKISCDIIFMEGDNVTHFDGYVSALDLDFPEEGVPQLTLTCLDNGHVMNRTKKSKTWSGKTRPEVAKEIATSYGFKFVSESGYTFDVQETITQSEKTDLEFIESLAGEETQKFLCKLVGDTVYYIKLGLLNTPKADLHYKESPYNALSFSPQITTETLKTKVTKSDINSSTKTTETGEADDSTDRDVQGESATSSGAMKEPTYVYDANKQDWVVS